MNKNNCYRIKEFLESLYKEKGIRIKIVISDKNAKGNWFWLMKIKVFGKQYKHLYSHIYATAYAMCALDGELLDKERKERGYLILS